MCAAALATGALLTSAGVAAAAPQPTVTQVQQKLTRLLSQQDQAVQQYDQSAQALTRARHQLTALHSQESRQHAQFMATRKKIAQLAAAAYETGTLSSAGALLTSANPQVVISQAGLLTHLKSDQAIRVSKLITTARQLTAAEQGAARTALAVQQMMKQQAAWKKTIAASVARQRTLLAQMTPQQQTAMMGAGTTSAVYTGTTATQAGKAVAFAYSQLGKPYLYGGTGPGAWDCSGLVQAAWGSAGVSIPRTTYDQWASLPHVPLSELQLGDLVYFDGYGHVAIYVGGGYIIDAPTTGSFVEKIPLNSYWYATMQDGAARP